MAIIVIGAGNNSGTRAVTDFEKSWMGKTFLRAHGVDLTLQGACIRADYEEDVVVWVKQPSFSIHVSPRQDTEGGVLKLKLLNVLPNITVSGMEENDTFEKIGKLTMAVTIDVRSPKELHFKPASIPEKFQFAIFGDIRPDKKPARTVFKNMLEELEKEQLDFVLAVGDLTNHGEKKEYLELIKRLELLQVPFYTVPGDHDTGDANEGLPYYRKVFGQTYYSFDYGQAHFVLLDNVSRIILDNGRDFATKYSISPRQMQWLKQDMEKSSKPHKFLFIHVPPFDPRPGGHHAMKDSGMAEEFMKAVESANVTSVFCGHVHGYWQVERNDVQYVFTGGGGARLYEPKTFHNYVRVTVDTTAPPEKAIKIEPVKLSSR